MTRSSLRDFRPTLLAVGMAALAVVAVVVSATVSAQGRATTVDIVDDPVLGFYLVDANGFSLYARRGEEPGRLRCTGRCLEEWTPLVLAAGRPTGPTTIQADLGIFDRGDGTQQVSYQGQPLYRSRDDAGPNQGRGNGRQGAWFAVNVLPAVFVSVHPQLGEILVGPTGMTLYTYTGDPAGAYQCDEGCSENFPPLVITFTSGASARLRGEVTNMIRVPDSRHGRRVQVTYRGRPLYFWSRDQQPGDVTGNGIAGKWEVARPR